MSNQLTQSQIAEILRTYWAHEFVPHPTIEGRLQLKWTYKTTDIALADNLTQRELLTWVKENDCPAVDGLVCVDCGQGLWLPPTRVTSRTAFEERWRHAVTPAVLCQKCYEIRREKELAEAKAKAERYQAEQERLRREQESERELERESKRAAAEKKYGERIVGDCPQCTGFLILRWNSVESKPFIGCSTFNAFRHGSCRFSHEIDDPAEYAAAVAFFKQEVTKRAIEVGVA